MRTITDDVDYLSFLGKQESQYLENASTWADEVVDRIEGKQDYQGDLLPWGKSAGKVALRPGEVSLWGGYNGHGKALSLDTEIPTPDGWTTMGALRVGDIVFDENGNTCEVVAETQVMIGRPCYKMKFSDRTEIICDEEHEWLTWTMKARSSRRVAKRNNRLQEREIKKFGTDQSHKMTKASVVTTKQIASSVLISSGGNVGKTEHSIPVAGAIKTKEKLLPIDPYILGLWLGDGTSADAGFTTADKELLDYFVGAGYQVTKRRGKYTYGVCGGLGALLRSEGLRNNKHIPYQYLRSSYDQRLALLQGLMDTDGHITNYGRCEFTSVKINIAEKVHELVLSLGVQACLIEGEAMLNGRSCGKKYRVTFTPDFKCFRLPRKSTYVKDEISFRAKQRYIVSCEKITSVPVKCIQVNSNSNLYLATRSFIPTHNSQLLGQVCAWGLKKKWLIASLEMKPAATLQRMVRQVSGLKDPSPKFARDFLSFTDDRLWIYDQQDTVKAERILGMVHYAGQVLKVDHVIIDSLMKCGLGTDDYNSQKDFLDRLCWAAKSENIHIHLIHHMRKGTNEYNLPGKHDYRGAGEITDLVDNCFIVFRNKSKEIKVRGGEVVDEPDCILKVDKQRNGEWEGLFKLWFLGNSLQYVAKEGVVMPYFLMDGCGNTWPQ